MVARLIVILLLIFTLGRLVHYFSNPRHQLIEKPEANYFTTWRQLAIDRLLKWLPSDEGALASGILLGGKVNLSLVLQTAFRRTGLMHVIAASGYNVSVVASWSSGLLVIWLGRRWAISGVILCIVMYTLIAGATASVVRAAIMAIFAQLGLLLGREKDARYLLLATAWVMLMWDPGYLEDIGFQLSFAATAGILWLRPQGDLWTTLAAQATTVPLIWHHFGQISLISPVINALVLWSVPIIMQVNAVGLIFGPINYLAWPLLKYMTSVVLWSARLPGASIEIGNISWFGVIIYYLVLLILLWDYKSKVGPSKG